MFGGLFSLEEIVSGGIYLGGDSLGVVFLRGDCLGAIVRRGVRLGGNYPDPTLQEYTKSPTLTHQQPRTQAKEGHRSSQFLLMYRYRSLLVLNKTRIFARIGSTKKSHEIMRSMQINLPCNRLEQRSSRFLFDAETLQLSRDAWPLETRLCWVKNDK